MAHRRLRRAVHLLPDLLLRPAPRQKFAGSAPAPSSPSRSGCIFSLLFSLYASTFGGNSYNETYGSLGRRDSPDALRLLLGAIMLVGAEMNQVIEWHIPGGKNEGEKIPEDDRKPDVHRLTGKSTRRREPVAIGPA